MAGGRQLRLLLWKDYLTRKRKLITLAGIIWASGIMFSMYIVRMNVDNEDFPACQFPARALPSAGVVTFLQSFICSVNNECSAMDQYEEIPTYENATLTHLQRKLSPIMNETVLDVASSVPDALKLLGTLAEVVDEPTFLDFTKNGLTVSGLFTDPRRVKRYVTSRLGLTDDVAQGVMTSEINFQGILKGNFNRCNAETISKIIDIKNREHIDILANKLCSLSSDQVQRMVLDLMMEINFSKYINMFGEMYYKLSGDTRLTELGDMLASVVRMTKLTNFLPPELVSLFYGQDTDFSYLQLSLIPKFLDLFKPTFGDTQSYKSIEEFADIAVQIIKYINKIFSKSTNDTSNSLGNGNKNNFVGGLKKVSNLVNNAVGVFEDVVNKNQTIDVFNVLSQLTNFVHKFLPDNYKHDVLFYSTLLSKLMESAEKVININTHLENVTYEVTLRNPDGIKVLKGLPPYIVGKAFDALADAQRTQILTSRINNPGQMFCDANKIASFFVIAKGEADSLKKKFCTDAWKNYVSDLIQSLGVFQVRDNINNMASLFIQETLGQDTSDSLYSIDKDFKILKNFTKIMIKIDAEVKPKIEWETLFKEPEDSELIKLVTQKGKLGKQILITIHGALAKEVVKQNPILDYKISPMLIDMMTLIMGISEQLESTPAQVASGLKIMYGDVVGTLMRTALNEEKTYKSLSTPGKEIFCKGVGNADIYLNFPSGVDKQELVSTLCNASILIESGLQNTSAIARAIAKIRNAKHGITEQVDWTKLINSIKQLCMKVDTDYPYLFEFSSYGMDEETRAGVKVMWEEAKVYWFGVRNLRRSLHLSVKLGLRFLDFMDRGIFDITDTTWLKIKHVLKTLTGPLIVLDDTVKLVSALLTNSSYMSRLPPLTVNAVSVIIPNLPRLIIDFVDIIVKDNTDIQPIISIMNANPPWPCSSTSISELLLISLNSKDAVRGIETLLCMDRELQMEWAEYLDKTQARVMKWQDYNSTRYEPHVFLKFSATFDSVINDTGLIKDTFQYILNDEDQAGLMSALDFVIHALNNTDRNEILRKMLNKFDTTLNAISTSTVQKAVSLNAIWENYTRCSNVSYIDEECRDVGRAAWKYALKTLSVIFESIAVDLMTYFTEINEPDSNLLQVVGFTKSTGVYMLYDRMPEFIAVLLNSYWDYGFMSQVRRAAMSQFYDCEAVVSALTPLPGTSIDRAVLARVRPMLCPSFLYWLSLPRGDNTLLDVVAKPQYFFYTHPVQNMTSTFETAFGRAVELADFISDIAKRNKTIITDEDLKLNNLQNKLEKFVDTMLSYRINDTDPGYIKFDEAIKKEFVVMIYLTRVVTVVNKLYKAIENYQYDDINVGEDELKQVKDEVHVIRNIYRRRSADAIKIHFDVITDILWADNVNKTLIEAFDEMCNDTNSNNTDKVILADEKSTKNILCAKQYKIIYSSIQNIIVDDYEDLRRSLDNVVKALQSADMDNVDDIFKFLSSKVQYITFLKSNINYSYDLGLTIYLKYLQSNLQSYDVVLTFLSGGDWWTELKELYSGPHTTQFFGYVEKSFDIAEDVLTNLDRVHLVRLIRDMNANSTESFCQSNITLSDYIPDVTGAASQLKRQLCDPDKVPLFRDLPPLQIASQGYENDLKLSKVIDYESLYNEIATTESRLNHSASGPRTPQRPPWVTDEKVARLRATAVGLLSKESLAKAAFGIMGNIVDAGTLFLNNSQCTLCSSFTTWFKQINLQLFKKDEYDNLLCHMHSMTLEDIYYTLKNDFHWDMAIKELISTRNYTKYELNKSMTEFLELVKLHLLEDITADSTKLTECLTKNITRNEFGNVTLVLSVVAHITRLLRAELPHVAEVGGIRELRYLQQLATEVAHNIDVWRPIGGYLKSGYRDEIMRVVEDEEVVRDVQEATVNLHRIHTMILPTDEHINLRINNWEYVCEEHNCSAIAAVIRNNLNMSLIEKDLPNFQSDQFWRFTFVSNILHHLEDILAHTGRLVGVASTVDVVGVAAGKLEALLDMALTVLTDDVVHSVLYSLQGIIDELHPLLKGTPLEHDLKSLTRGLEILYQIKTYLVEEEDLKMEVSQLFPNPDKVEAELGAIGINNTNFWSLAAPGIHAGYIDIKPIFSKQQNYRISNFVCRPEDMSQVLLLPKLEVLSADNVYEAVTEQFCELSDERAKRLVPLLLQNFNFSIVIEKVTNKVLPLLYSASNLTREEGATVLAKFPQMAALLPALQQNLGEVVGSLGDEPLFQSLKDFSSVGNLLGSSDLMANAGKMLCGKPFRAKMPRILMNIISNKDNSDGPSQAQLDALPTDFCKSMYKEIISIDGGKIVWSFVKPLIMGKILYTPPHPAVERIIEKANTTFATILKITSLVHSFANAFPALDSLSSHRAGLAALRRVITANRFHALREMMIGDELEMPNLEVDGLFDQFGDLKGMGRLLGKASELVRCVNLSRLQGARDEHHLTHEAARLAMLNEFTAGIVFLNTETYENNFTNVEYKIRMDIENVPTTTKTKNYLWTPGPESSFVENLRYFRGFVQIQDMVDKAIIQLSHNHSIHKRETRTENDLDWAVYTQQIPYPCYRKDFFQTSLYESQALLVAFFFSLLFTVASAVRFIVSDKETGNTMLMSVMGVNLSYHTLSWFIMSLLELTVTVTIMTLLLHYGIVIPRTDPTLVFALFFVFGLSVISFCYMMSKLFTSASFAAVCSAIAYLITFMPFVMILSLEAVMVSSLKMLVCLSMSSSLCYAFLFITRYEAAGAGAHWSDVWSAPAGAEDMNMARAAAMMLLDAVLYFIIGMLIDKYYGIKTLQSNITNCTTTDEKAGVSILNVTKVYGEGTRRSKLALDNVSIELHKGQITTLLGHNGAGKTTLVNILTGMLKPTKGHVIIRSEREGGTRLGVCPQRDVLFEYMTAREHIALYAYLKNETANHVEIREEVERMLQVLSLGAWADAVAARLSGGTRRRLCVALAFVARPHLVSLDEPTSGVDPAARRDIWSMIVKLKEDRTILLTTHHLDEAELLSDQIVIMDKGQIHTTGSPIEIKRTLGSGYKLTVMYPDPKAQEWADDVTLDEKTKQLLTLVRDVVKNASLADVNGLEVELLLPFYDANGLNNDFLQLCTLLEASQEALGFTSYNMDCSSLEQVFFDICQHHDPIAAPTHDIDYESLESPSTLSKTGSSSSIKDEQPLVPPEGPLRGSWRQQFVALMRIRYLHHIRNRWLMFMLVGLPSLFVVVAMAFSMLRPPADNEVALRLVQDLYPHSTDFLLPRPSIYPDSNHIGPTFAEHILDHLEHDKHPRNWTTVDSPTCKCIVTRQECDIDENSNQHLPDMMLLPDLKTLNSWLVDSQEVYIEKRYGGYTSTVKNNRTNLIAWYNNKGHHALPIYVNSLNSAVLQSVLGNQRANITVYSHPLKISKEQISKDTVYQHVADAGISSLVLVGYALVSAGAALQLVAARTSQQRRLQLLCGVSPALYWAVAALWDLMIILINMALTAIIMLAFGYPVFVARNNLPAICILIVLYGYACVPLTHVLEKLFTEPSMANMILFCGNSFLGLAGITILLILDIISESDATDNARWILHKIFMLSPQFVLGDGLLEICKNTIQAQVLLRFGMDTYQDPFSTDLMVLHYTYPVVVGTLLFLFNLAIEYDCFESLIVRFRSERIPELGEGGQDAGAAVGAGDAGAERRRVRSGLSAPPALRLHTIGNINRGYVNTECKKNSIQRVGYAAQDVAQVVDLGKVYPARPAPRPALRRLTLGLPAGQCTALLGQNGSGKSTTFGMLTGEVRPSTGQIYLNGKKVNSRKLCQGLISYCPQSDAIDPLLTVRETLNFYCELRGLTDQEEVVSRTLRVFSLRGVAGARCEALSGGRRRALCAATALMGRTPLVLLDEPTSGMDPVSRASVARGVRAARAGARGVLLSTHALADARRLADRVALLRAGDLLALASLDDCLRRFGGGYVVQCRVARGGPRAAWRRVAGRAPHAALRVLHHDTLHFLIPSHTTVDKKEITTRLSDVFRLMSELQSTCDIEDYTVNQSSLDQMFLSFADKAEVDLDPVDIEPLPSPDTVRKNGEEFDSITSL